MILNPEFSNYTIDAISQECGYNSKSTFNKAFKQITGLTPNEYKRQEDLSE
jgi:AraC-like DNA-binding protein